MPRQHHPDDLPSLRAFRARTILTMVPGAAPLRDGLLVAANGRIAAVGPVRSTAKGFHAPVADLGEVVLVPGLLNAHCHLELSSLPADFPRGRGFEAWVAWLMAHPLERLDPAAMGRQARAMRQAGAACVADVGNRSPGLAEQALDAAGLACLRLYEFFGFRPPKDARLDWTACARELPGAPDRDNLAAAGHALYSTHPETLRLAKAWDSARGRTFSLHLAEHPGEVETLATGRGAFADMLRRRVIPADYAPPGLSPVRAADALGLLDERTLAVHCVHLDAAEAALLAERGTNVCLCPRSNDVIGVGQAPWDLLRRAGVNFCLGTDSPASNDDLDLFNEARFLLARNAGFSPTELLAAMTVNAATALGLASEFGSLAPGKRAAFALLPPDLAALDPA